MSEDEVSSDTKDKELEEEVQNLKTASLDIERNINVHNLSQQVTEYDASDLISQLVSALSNKYDTTFLSDYLKVLRTDNEAAIKSVTCKVMSCIEDALRQEAGEGLSLGEQRVVLGAFLCTMSLAGSSEPNARAMLRQLLANTTGSERVVLAETWLHILPAAGLIALSDAVRAPRASHIAPDEPSLAELLLRAALCVLDSGQLPPQWQEGSPRIEELDGLVEAWTERRRSLDAMAAVALMGRVLGVAPPAMRAAFLRRLEPPRPRRIRAGQPPPDDRESTLGVSKLKILFGCEEKVKTPKKNKKATKET